MKYYNILCLKEYKNKNKKCFLTNSYVERPSYFQNKFKDLLNP